MNIEPGLRAIRNVYHIGGLRFGEMEIDLVLEKSLLDQGENSVSSGSQLKEDHFPNEYEREDSADRLAEKDQSVIQAPVK